MRLNVVWFLYFFFTLNTDEDPERRASEELHGRKRAADCAVKISTANSDGDRWIQYGGKRTTTAPCARGGFKRRTRNVSEGGRRRVLEAAATDEQTGNDDGSGGRIVCPGRASRYWRRVSRLSTVSRPSTQYPGPGLEGRAIAASATTPPVTERRNYNQNVVYHLRGWCPAAAGTGIYLLSHDNDNISIICVLCYICPVTGVIVFEEIKMRHIFFIFFFTRLNRTQTNK